MPFPKAYTLGLLACWILSLSFLSAVNPIPHPSSSCDLIVDAGPDTNVCAPGGLIQLQGSITGNDVFFQWTPYTGLNNPFILNPIANVSGTVTYTLTGWAPDPASPELVVNGDFESGNTGFSSDYTYVVDIPGNQQEMFPEGTYTVIDNPNLVHTGFSPCDDHTSGSGNMMVVNGAANFEDIWCQTVPVLPNSFYNVSAWVTSVNPSSPAQLQFSINGTPIGNVVNALPTPCVWIPFNATWSSGSNTMATICILNLNTELGGNDFAIDDISMIGLCAVSDEVELTIYHETAPEPEINGPAFVCAGETATYIATFPPDPPIYSYEWIVPAGASILSGQGTDEVTIFWTEDQEVTLCLDIETRCDANEGCFDVTVGTVPTLPFISGEASLCPGETATLYTPEQDPDDTYEWTLPSNVTLISGQGTNEIDIEWNAPGEAEICVEVTNACGSTDNCTLLSLYPNYHVSLDTTICQGSQIVINGHVYGNGTLSGTEFLITANGCDSVVDVTVHEATVLQYMVTENLCPGDSIYLEGAFQFLPGIYVDSFLTVSLCDSIIITTVNITPFDTTWLFSTTCDFSLAGTFITSYSQGNCDSTVISEITYIPPDTTLLISASCSSLDTGYSESHFVNIHGCDSLVIVDVNFLFSDTTRLFYTTCDPSQVGIQMTSFLNTSGCDSTVIENTIFSLSDTTQIHLIVCQKQDTGTVNTLLTNINGCDSLVTIHSVYGGSDTTFVFFSSCNAQDTGWQFNQFHNRFGCDSISALYTAFLHSDSTYITDTTCMPGDTGLFVSILTNRFGCDSTLFHHVVLDEYNACSLEVAYSISLPACYGGDVILHIDLVSGEGPFDFNWSVDDQVGTFQLDSLGHYDLLWPIPSDILFYLHSANGLQQEDTVLIAYPDPLIIDVNATSDYHGYNVPCFGDSLGEAKLKIIQSGTPPLSYQWSNGSTSGELTQLPSGLYTVTVTDDHGCTDTKSIEITQPPPITYTISWDDVSCHGDVDGSIFILDVQGGVSPWSTSLESMPFVSKFTYTGLSSGLYHLKLMDNNGCLSEKVADIHDPGEWSIHLQPDTVIDYGASFMVETQISGHPNGMLNIIWWDGACGNCLSREVEPTSLLMIKVEATDENGCTSSDEMTIRVQINRDLYIPNIFSPNGDGVNDLFLLNGNPSVKEISHLSIFDRWGDMVFHAEHFNPADPHAAWDGRRDGKLLNPGVFVYDLEAVYIDGLMEDRAGSVTLIR